MTSRSTADNREYMRDYMRERRRAGKDNAKPRREGEAWLAEEIDRLCAAVKRFGADWTRVVEEMPGRTIAACKQAYNSHEGRRRQAETSPSIAASPKRLKSWQDKRAKEHAAEQERAAALSQQRSTTSEFFGDPLPGRSALDKKLAGIVDEPCFDRRMVHVPKKSTLYTGGRA